MCLWNILSYFAATHFWRRNKNAKASSNVFRISLTFLFRVFFKGLFHSKPLGMPLNSQTQFRRIRNGFRLRVIVIFRQGILQCNIIWLSRSVKVAQDENPVLRWICIAEVSEKIYSSFHCQARKTILEELTASLAQMGVASTASGMNKADTDAVSFLLIKKWSNCL